MILIFLIAVVITVLLLLVTLKLYDNGKEIPSLVLFILTLLVGIAAITLMFYVGRWHISSQQLTGYIYQRSESFGYVTYDLRYSQNAGQDSQPSFCVEAGSEEDNKFKKLVGDNGAKVTVNVPSRGFFFVTNPWECSSFATLEKVEILGTKYE